MADETARETFLQRLGRERVIAILRSPDAGRFVDAARVLYDAGIRGIEVTLTTAGALEAIADVRSALPEDAWVGAGTVMTAPDVRVVAEAGDALRPGGDLTGLADRAAALVRSLPPAGATSGAGVGGVAVEAAR